jgi:hypothetical protein
MIFKDFIVTFAVFAGSFDRDGVVHEADDARTQQ